LARIRSAQNGHSRSTRSPPGRRDSTPQPGERSSSAAGDRALHLSAHSEGVAIFRELLLRRRGAGPTITVPYPEDAGDQVLLDVDALHLRKHRPPLSTFDPADLDDDALFVTAKFGR